MDPSDADVPCIVQALASVDPNDAADPPCIVQALAALPPSPLSKPQALPAAARDRGQPAPAPNPSGPPSPRRTRSGGAPEWTAAETLALVAAVAAVDDDGWARSVSAFQKWAIVAENLSSSEAAAAGGGGGRPSSRRGGRGRAAGECRRRWEALAAEYGAVRRWEVRTGGRYWEMGAAARRKAGLPAEFDAEVYDIMDALIRVEEEGLVGAGAGGGGGDGGGAEVGEEEGGDDGIGEEEEDGEEDDVVEEEDGKEDDAVDEEDDDDGEGEMQVDGGNVDAPNDLEGCETETNNEPKKSQIDAWELANKLNENAQHIHMILKGEVDEDVAQNHDLANALSPDAMETTRQKADELIKSLGGLVSYLNQFTDLIKENGFEDVIGTN